MYDGTSTPRASAPAPPSRQFSFTDWQTNNPSAPPPGDKLDAEFDRSNTAINQTLTWAGTSLNTDGSLRDGSVKQSTLVSGLFDDVAQSIIDEVQPLVDQANGYASAASASAGTAASSSSSALSSANSAGNAATLAQTYRDQASTAATTANAAATTAGNNATTATNAASNAQGSEADALDYSVLAQAWAEHMPDTIPPNILAVEDITGDHWSARWWATRAAEIVALAKAPVSTYVYFPSGSQTTFAGSDFHGAVLSLDPTIQSAGVYVNGSRIIQGTDFTPSTDQVSLIAGAANAGDVVEVTVTSLGALPPAPLIADLIARVGVLEAELTAYRSQARSERA